MNDIEINVYLKSLNQELAVFEIDELDPENYFLRLILKALENMDEYDLDLLYQFIIREFDV